MGGASDAGAVAAGVRVDVEPTALALRERLTAGPCTTAALSSRITGGSTFWYVGPPDDAAGGATLDTLTAGMVVRLWPTGERGAVWAIWATGSEGTSYVASASPGSAGQAEAGGLSRERRPWGLDGTSSYVTSLLWCQCGAAACVCGELSSGT